MSVQPPKYWIRFLRWFCREDFIDEIEGDLTEIFQDQHQHSPRTARYKLMLTVIRYFRPEYLKVFHKRSHLQSQSNFIMMLNYLNFAWRSLRKRTGFSLINIGG